jgi:hypothetical protein
MPRIPTNSTSKVTLFTADVALVDCPPTFEIATYHRGPTASGEESAPPKDYAYQYHDPYERWNRSPYNLALKERYHLHSSMWLMEDVNMEGPHPFPEALFLLHDEYSLGDEQGNFIFDILPITVPIPGKKWIDLWRAADLAILLSGDPDHIYIEGFDADVMESKSRCASRKKKTKIPVVWLSTGS